MLENTAVGNVSTSITWIHEGIVFGSHLHSIKSYCVDFEFDMLLNLKSPSRTLSKSWCFTRCLRPQASPSFEIILSQVCLKHSHTFWQAWAMFQGYYKAKTPAKEFFFLLLSEATFTGLFNPEVGLLLCKSNLTWYELWLRGSMQVFMGFN